MKKLLSIMLTVLMCFSSIAGTMINVSAANTPAVFTIDSATAEAGDIKYIDIKYSSAEEANLIAIAQISLSNADAVIEGFEFSDSAKAVINTGLSNYDPDTNSIITLFNAAQTFDGVLGTLQVKVSDNAKDGVITISAAGSRVQNEGVGEVASSVENGTIIVGDVAPAGKPAYTIGNAEATPGETVNVDIRFASDKEVNLIALGAIEFDPANAEIVGFAFSDEAKAVINTALSNYDPDTNSIITLFNNAQTFDGILGTLQVKVNENAPEGDIEIKASSRVQNEGVGVYESEVVAGKITVAKEVVAEKAKYTIGNVEETAGEIAEVPVTFTTTQPVNLISLYTITLGSSDAEIVDFVFSDEAKAVINTGLSNYDPDTKSVVTLFNNAQTFDGVLGTLKIKINENAPTGNITISASSNATNEGVGPVETEVVAGSIAVTAKAPTLKGAEFVIGNAEAVAGETVDVAINFATDTNVNLIAISEIKFVEANAEIAEFVFSDEAKAVINTALSNYDPATGSIIVLFNEAQVFDGVLCTLKVKVAENAPTGDIAITAGSMARNEGVGDVTSKVTDGKIAVTEKAVELEGAEFVIGDAEAVAGDTVDVAISYTTDTPANLVGIGGITFDPADAQIVGFEFSDAAKAVINTGLSNYDPATKSIVALFNEAQTFDGILGILKVKVADAAPTGDIAITAGSSVQNENAGEGEKVVTSKVTAGKIAVTEKAPVVEPEIKGITVTADAVEIADADKADTAKIEAAIRAAIKAIKAQWTEGKEDTDVKVDDVTITVDTANKKATVTYEGFTADVTYTVAAPIPVMTGITVTADAVEIADADKADTAKIEAAIKAAIKAIKAQWTEGKADTDVAVDDVTITVDTANKKATVTYEGFTADVTYTVAAPIPVMTGIVAEPAAVEVPYGTAQEDVAKAIADAIKVYPTYADNTKGEAIVDFGVEINGREDTATITTGNFETTVAVTYATQDAKLVAPEHVTVPYKNHNEKSDAEIADYIKDEIEGKVKYVDIYGEEFEVADTYIVTYADEKATVSYEGLEAEIKVTLGKKSGGSSVPSGTVVRPGGSATVTNPEIKGIDVTADAVEIPEADKSDAAKIEDAVKDAITNIVVQWTEGKADTEVDVDDVTITVDTENKKATVAYKGFEDVINYTVENEAASDIPYTDVEKDDWAYDIIKDLSDKGIINGDYGNTLRPGFGITREEVAKLVLKVKGIEVDESLELNIPDPESVSDWAKGYVATAVKYGILKGYDDGTMKGNQIVTRAELSAIIVRALNATSDVTNYSFTDVTADDWFADTVECAKNLGIVKGYEDGTFRGNNDVTRREAFAMAHRMMTLIAALEQ